MTYLASYETPLSATCRSHLASNAAKSSYRRTMSQDVRAAYGPRLPSWQTRQVRCHAVVFKPSEPLPYRGRNSPTRSLPARTRSATRGSVVCALAVATSHGARASKRAAMRVAAATLLFRFMNAFQPVDCRNNLMKRSCDDYSRTSIAFNRAVVQLCREVVVNSS
jgi:hypothetical protein